MWVILWKGMNRMRENGRWLTNLYKRMYTHVNICSEKKRNLALTHSYGFEPNVYKFVLSISFARFHQDLMRNILYACRWERERDLYLKAQPILMRIFLVTFHSNTHTFTHSVRFSSSLFWRVYLYMRACVFVCVMNAWTTQTLH